MSDYAFLAVVGAGAVLLGLAGLAGVVVPGVSASFAFVVLVGIIAGIQGLRYALGRREVNVVETETGTPESRYRVPAPGDDDWRTASHRGPRPSTRRGRDRSTRTAGFSRRHPRTLRQRIRDVAVETIGLREHCSAERAERVLDTGDWTDDPVAARFLGADVPVSLSTRLRFVFSRSSYLARALRTLDAVEALDAREGSVLPADRDASALPMDRDASLESADRDASLGPDERDDSLRPDEGVSDDVAAGTEGRG
ncbi:DUF7269 family protein [Halobellus rarus]|uniref:Uncharacterized protein n=1 Tax=Halobellus rarus TaxID=1126237 RepID=A0ABD6CKR3_9EURY|nr:hypothetical protein [Halobellus rarus]